MTTPTPISDAVQRDIDRDEYEQLIILADEVIDMIGDLKHRVRSHTPERQLREPLAAFADVARTTVESVRNMLTTEQQNITG